VSKTALARFPNFSFLVTVAENLEIFRSRKEKKKEVKEIKKDLKKVKRALDILGG
jgi:hypothetical protein